MASQLRVDEIIASTGSSVAIGTAGGSVTLAGDFTVDTSKGLNVGTGATIFSPSSNVLTLGTNSAERVRITSTGSVGIGTNSPLVPVHVEVPGSGTSDAAAVVIKNASTSYGRSKLEFRSHNNFGRVTLVGGAEGTAAGNGSFDLEVWDNSGISNRYIRVDGESYSNYLAFWTGSAAVATNAERMRITNTGNIGIGTNNPTYRLQLEGLSNDAPFLINTNNVNGPHIRFAENGSVKHYIGCSPGLGGAGNSEDLAYRSADSHIFLTGTTERVVIDGNGNATFKGKITLGESYGGGEILRIGKTSGSSYTAYHTGGSAHGFIGYADQIVSGGGSNNFAIRAENNLFFTSGGNTERLRIASNGEFYFGNNTSNTWASGVLFSDLTSTTSYIRIGHTATGAGYAYLVFGHTNTPIGSISQNSAGNAVSFNTTSDHRLKENVIDLDGAIARVKQLSPKRFNFIGDYDNTVDGFLAHEAQTIVPEAVTGTHNEVDDEGNPVYQGIDQSKLVPLLTAALQEAIVKIETLEAKVSSLENP